MKHIITTIIIVAGAFALAAAQAQPMHHHDEGPKADAGGYAPGLGEIMSFQQMRHSKLWSAGRAGNWGLAAYEIDELKEGFEDVAKYAPSVQRRRASAHCGCDRQKSASRSRQDRRGERSQAVRGKLRPAHRRLQFLPPSDQARVHRHPTPNRLALHQPDLYAGGSSQLKNK